MTIDGATRREASIASIGPDSRRLYRSAGDRMLAGVAGGLARHLRIAPLRVRIAFVLLTAFGGFGIVLYAAYWAVVPQEPATGELAGGDRGGHDGRPGMWSRAAAGPAVAFAVLGVGLLLLWQQVRPFASNAVVYAGLLVGCGLAVIWLQADEAQQARLQEITGASRPAAGRRARLAAALRLGAGSALVVAGLAAVLLHAGGLPATRDAAVAAAVVLLGTALITAPWWARVVQMLAAERRERIRSQERADLAAHLHDSVLHTLALIQRHADSPREVARLARGQERELRSWLYRAKPVGSVDRFAAALEQAAAEVEDAYAVAVEAVVVGDAELDERLAAVVQAAREALVNAARHAEVAEVSLYAEVEATRVSVFVRDRGVGFDPDTVPGDRHGIDGSIVGRMRRHGGTAVVRSRPGAGTEVELCVGMGG